MKAFSVLAVAALLALAAATASKEEPAARALPNIVFITSDDHRWDGIGARRPDLAAPRRHPLPRP